MTPVTTETLGSVDTVSMETKAQTPILDAIRRQHAEEDKARGVDPYNTGRHRTLVLHSTTPAQRAAAEDLLVGRDTDGWL